jgi:plasmid stability protein
MAATMAELRVTNIEDKLLRAIELRAEATGQTVEETTRELIELGFKLDPKGHLAVSDYVRSMQPAPLSEDSTDLIRRLRDAR